jgi:hypothetical protein
MERAFMSSNWSRDAASAILIYSFACAPSVVYAGSTEVCPVRKHAKVVQIYIFDGKPEEQVFLAPDDDEKSPNTYTLAKIHQAGRTVTVRCEYSRGPVYDTELKKKVKRCQSSESKSGSYSLVCR